jgi:hypothetical protein
MTTLLRRSAVIGSTLVVAIGLVAPAAVADDLSDLLGRAHDATYTATRVTVSAWGDQTNITKERVEHAKGSEMIRVDETWSMVGNGRTATMGDTPEGIAFMTNAAPVPTGRYEVGSSADVRHMYRNCSLVPVLEDGRVRARILVDDLTGAPLITYLYDGTGRVFRTVSLSDFSPHRTYEWPKDSTDVPFEIVMHDDDETVPSQIAGYVLVDEFPGPGSSEQGFYSDGLFNFSLFVMPASTVVEGFDDPMSMVTDHGVYEMVPTAQTIRVHWTDGDDRYVLVGDLPPDHLREVLAALPDPGAGGMLARLWHRLFG